MIEEQELLQGAWIELAMFTEQQRRRRDAIGLPRTVKSENIRLVFLGADQRVVDRRENDGEHRQYQRCERQHGGIAHVAYLALRAPE
jgi:hypothetical protein